MNGKRIGRPPNAKGKRSTDLGRYIEATFDGATPGQQSAQLCMVSPRELRQAKAAAKDLGLLDLGLDEFTLAMVVKAKRLAKAIGCETRDAWLLLQKERADLMPYIHQRRPQAAEDKGKAPVLGYMIPDDAGPQQALPDFGLDDDDDAIEIVDENPGAADQVSRPKSHD